MKRITTIILMLFCTLITINAQQLFQRDKNVRIGKLSNGLTYYIRHNAEPKDRAYFYIAQKVGAIQEAPDQRGLAHFLEHMAFNGTKNFPGTSLRTYLETIGVKFGADLNAYTATDETVYNIDNVPTTVSGAIDSCLLILHDWSHNLTLADDAINEERGVIQEEWRARNSAMQRINEQMMPVIMAGSKYSDAMPIGNMDIVMHFKPQTLRDYYAKWYRPDLQGIVVVGDVDVNQIEAKIKNVFADIKAPGKNAAKRIYYPVPDNKSPIYFLGKDKELTSPSVQFFFKSDVTPRDKRNSREYMVNSLFGNFFYNMFHDRTREIAQTPNAPFSLAYARVGNYFLANTKRSLTAIVSCHSTRDGITNGVRALLEELFRVRRYGFTETEFDRYRKDMLVSLDNLMKEKDKRQSTTFVNEYVRNFLDGEPMPSLNDEVAFWRQELPKLTAEDMNHWFSSLFKANDENIVIAITAPQTDSLNIPNKEQMLALYHEVEHSNLMPYVDQINTLPMLPHEPVAGTIVSEVKDKKGRDVWMLSNGAKVIIKRTNYKEDQILVQQLSKGGYSLYSPEDYRLGPIMGMASAVVGLGNWNLADLQKNTTGITAHVQGGIAENYQSVAGSCSPKDIKYLLEMMHAAIRYPNKDEKAFAALMERLEKSSRESEGKPSQVYGDSIRATFYGDNPYAKELKAEDYKKIDYNHLLDLWKQSFADASSFTFTVIGNVDIDSLRPYVCKYLASLPATYQNPQAKPVLTYKPGSRTNIFKKKQETPKASLYIVYQAPCDFSLKNELVASILGQVLTIKYTQTIREEAGAAYSPNAGAKVDYFPSEVAKVIVRFPTSPETLQKARELVDKGLDEIIKDGPTQTDVNKVKEYLLKTIQGNRTVNEYWQFVMSYEWNHNADYDEPYEQVLNSITLKDIQQMAKKIKAGQRLECDMTM